MWMKAADVLETDLGDEMVLMHTGSSEMFSLNGAGRVIWTHLPATEDQLTAHLVQHFDIDDATARQDVHALLSDLRDQTLVRHDP